MKNILMVLALGLFLCSTINAFQGGGGEPAKKKTVLKKKSSPRAIKPSRPPASASPARASSRPSTPATAALAILANPDSVISIDGESIGETDENGSLSLPSFKPGVYIISASKVGYLGASKNIALSAGRKETITFELAIATQTLNIVSSPPESEVYINDVLRGSTDASGRATITDLKIGEHRITLRKSRYREATYPITLSLEKEGQINASLELVVGFLTVKTNVPNPSIGISGLGYFDKPFSRLECQPGAYSVTISSPSYVTSTKEVIVRAGQEAEVSVDLVAYAEVRSDPEVNTGSSEAVTETKPTVTTPPSSYVVPNGVAISGILENEINTKNSQNYDRFTIMVRSPDEFRGATIQGYISGVDRAGKVSGRSSVTLNFDQVTLRNGQTYNFAGNLQSIIDPKGKSVKVDNEGTVKGSSRTQKAVKRGGIGAVFGAIIGGAVGGAAGAAIGAAAGGAAAAGSVAMQGGEDIKLKKGSTISLQSSSPIRN